jgi:phenolic acid decarboxylase
MPKSKDPVIKEKKSSKQHAKEWLKALTFHNDYLDKLARDRKERYEKYSKTFVTGTHDIVHVKSGSIKFQKLYEAKTP